MTTTSNAKVLPTPDELLVFDERNPYPLDVQILHRTHRIITAPLCFRDGRIYDISAIRLLDASFLSFVDENTRYVCEVEINQRSCEWGHWEFEQHFTHLMFDQPMCSTQWLNDKGEALGEVEVARKLISKSLLNVVITLGEHRTPLPRSRWPKPIITVWR